MEYNHGALMTLKGLALRVLARDVAEDRSVVASRPVEQNRDVCNANAGRDSDQIDKRILIHEIVQKFAVLHQMRLWDVERLRFILLGLEFHSRERQARYQIASLHIHLPGVPPEQNDSHHVPRKNHLPPV